MFLLHQLWSILHSATVGKQTHLILVSKSINWAILSQETLHVQINASIPCYMASYKVHPFIH